MVTVTYRPMKSAPTEGTEIVIKCRDGRERIAWYKDCEWLRRPFDVSGVTIQGDRTFADCWVTWGGEEIELKDAKGWRPQM